MLTKLDSTLLEALFVGTPQAINVFEWDDPPDPGSFRLVASNPANSRMTGVDVTRFHGLRIGESFPALLDSELPGIWARVIESGETETFETTYGDHTFEPARYLGHVVKLAARSVGVFFEDVTQRRALEAQLETRSLLLERRGRELQRLFSVAAHDLRSPLTGVMGYAAEVLRRARETGADAIADATEHLLAGARQLERLLDGFASVAVAGGETLRLEHLEMREVINDVRDSLAFGLDERQARLDVGPLPPCRADRLQVTRLFTNLVSNAIKYADPQRGLEIKIWGERFGTEVVYSVADTGIGIATEDLERIFEIFTRVCGGETEGNGLGLAVVQRIVDRHAGRVWVESAVGQGSTFFVSLPTG